MLDLNGYALAIATLGLSQLTLEQRLNESLQIAVNCTSEHCAPLTHSVQNGAQSL